MDFTNSATEQPQVWSWVAMTYRKLGLPGNSLVSGISENKRKSFLSEAAVAIEEVLSCADLSQKVRTSWQRELVGVRSNLGQWDEAVEQMRFILANQQNNRSPMLQQFAADLFQKAGRTHRVLSKHENIFNRRLLVVVSR